VLQIIIAVDSFPVRSNNSTFRSEYRKIVVAAPRRVACVTKSRHSKILLADLVLLISVNCRCALKKIAFLPGSSGIDGRGGDNDKSGTATICRFDSLGK
jgi:hypothetical protein